MPKKTKLTSINTKKPVLHNKQQSKTVFLEEGDHESGLLKPADREEMRPDSFLEEDESESENDDSADNQDVNDKDQDDDDFDRMKKQLAELAEENDDFLEEAKKAKKYPADMPIDIEVSAIGVPGIASKMEMTASTVDLFTGSLPLYGLDFPESLPSVESV